MENTNLITPRSLQSPERSGWAWAGRNIYHRKFWINDESYQIMRGTRSYRGAPDGDQGGKGGWGVEKVQGEECLTPTFWLTGIFTCSKTFSSVAAQNQWNWSFCFISSGGQETRCEPVWGPAGSQRGGGASVQQSGGGQEHWPGLYWSRQQTLPTFSQPGAHGKYEHWLDQQ